MLLAGLLQQSLPVARAAAVARDNKALQDALPKSGDASLRDLPDELLQAFRTELRSRIVKHMTSSPDVLASLSEQASAAAASTSAGSGYGATEPAAPGCEPLHTPRLAAAIGMPLETEITPHQPSWVTSACRVDPAATLGDSETSSLADDATANDRAEEEAALAAALTASMED
jgi:hypothetical protein